MRKWIFLYLILALAVPAAWPQASTSTVNGTVSDETGAVIPGADVTLLNKGTNGRSRTTTNEVGFYIFPGVTPGAYLLTVETAGMQKFEGSISVQVQQTVAVNAVLRPGTTTTVIEVQDVTPVTVTDVPTLGHVLERQRIEQLPINGRSLTSLLVTVPGMEGNRAYGMREGSQEMVLDGAALTDRLWGGNPRRQPALDSVQEFKVENNSSSAKFNRPTSIVLSTKSGTNGFHGSLFETHRNNAIGKARKRQDGSAKPPQLIRNEFGGSAGGPVLLPKIYDGRDRTFWFFTYEGNRTINPSTKGYQVPTAAMRAGDFTGLVDASGRQYKIYDPYTTNPATGERQQISYQGRLNVIDPARMSPVAKYLYSVTPLPTDPAVNPLIDNNWWGPAVNTTRNWTTTTRFDHRFSDYDQFYARYTHGDFFRINDFYGQPMLDNVAGTNRTLAPNKSLAASYLHTFGPTLFNELMVSVSRENAFSGTGEPGVYYNDMLGLPNPMGVPGWPGIYDTGLDSYYFETQNTNRAAFTNYILDNNATKIYGRHEFQFGGHLRYDQLNYLPEQQHPQGNHNFNSRATALLDPVGALTNPQPLPYTGSNLANMYLGLMNYSNQFVRGYFYARAKEYALYFQDNFRVNQRLTLNLGLRWEKWPAYYEKNNMMTSFDPASQRVVLGQDMETMYRLGGTVPSIVNRLQVLGAEFATYKEVGMPKHLMSSGWRDFGPRLGFAYRAGDGAGSFVVRGGYRVSYFPIPLAPWGQRMRQNAPLTARFVTSQTEASQSPDGLPNWGMRSVPTVVAGVNSQNAVRLDDASRITRGQAVVSYFSPDQPDSRVHDWNLTLEKEIAKNTVARAAYLGNHVSNLEQYFRFNEATPEYIWYVTTGTRLPTGEFAGVARRPYNQQVYGTMEEYRKSGWSNFQGAQFELERRYSSGFAYQIFYNFGNAFTAGGKSYSGVVPNTNVFLPGAVPQDYDERNRLFNYQRDVTIPKHRLRWNWVADLPFGRGKKFGGNAGGVLDKVIGGWQITGMGSLWSSYWQLPTTVYPNGNDIEVYGYDYPIQDCRSGACRPGYLYWNGYINPNQINSYDANGKPNGVMGVPDNYRPAGQPLNPWPLNPSTSDPMYGFYGSNTVWVPLNDGTTQRVNFDNGLHPWRQQYLPGPRQWNVDASIVKNIPITETVNLRFNADIFNIFNHPNNPAWTGSNAMPVAADGVYSTFTSGLESRELQLSLRLSW